MRALILAFGLLISITRVVNADGIEDFQAAMEAWDQGNLDAAIELMGTAVKDPSLPDETKAGMVVYRGMAQTALGKSDAAIADFQYAIEVDPMSVDARTNLGVIYEQAGSYDLALRYHREALEASSPKGPNPELVATNNNLAWLLATCPDDQVRDGVTALSHATSAITMITDYWPDADKVILASSYDTLAASYAEVGNFELAVATMQKAIGELDANAIDIKSEFNDRLSSYEAGVPWRISPP